MAALWWGLLLLFAGPPISVATGQDPGRSQRILPLPPSGPQDLQTQFRLMQELQRLKQDADEKSETISSESSTGQGLSPNEAQLQYLEQLKNGLSPEQRDALESLLKQFPTSQRQGNDNGLGTNAGDSAPSNRVRELLEQFQRSGQLPPPSNNGLTSDSTNGLPMSRDGTGVTRPDPDPGSSSIPNSSSTPRSIGDANGPASRVPGENSNAERPSEDSIEPLSSNLSKTLDELMRRAAEEPSSLPPLELPPYLQPLADGNASQFNQGPSNQGRSNQGATSSGRANSRRASSGQSNSQQSNSQQSRSVQPLPGVSQRAGQEIDTQSSVTAPGDSAAAVAEKRRREALESLNSRGLERTFQDIVRQSQREAKTQVKSQAEAKQNNSGKSGWLDIEEQVLKSLEGARQEIVQLANESAKEQRARGNGLRASESPSTPSRDASAIPGLDGNTKPRGDSFLKGLGDVFRRATSESSGGLLSAPSSASGAGSEVVATGAWGAMLEWIVILGFLAVGLYLWFRMNPGTLPKLSSGHEQRAVERVEIRSRADVVRAFHQLVSYASTPVEPWWSHRRAADVFTGKRPAATGPMQELSQLYEVARYLPEHQSMTDDQLSRARTAMQRLREMEPLSV